MKFYATAKNEQGQHFVIYNNETFTDRLTAQREAERIAKAEGLVVDNVRPVVSKETQGSVLKKYDKSYFRNNKFGFF
jgi:hypothetical protein